MSFVRNGLVVVMLLVAVVLQIAVFDVFSVNGVVPNLVLLVVVAAAVSRGTAYASVVGLLGGLLLDIVPPADHLAGRWALAMVVVAVLAGRVGEDTRQSALAGVLTVGACSFVGTSLFALTGLVTGDRVLPVGQLVAVVVVGVLYDLVLAPLLLRPLVKAFDRMRRSELAA